MPAPCIDALPHCRVKERRKKAVGKQVRSVLPKATVDTSLQVGASARARACVLAALH